MLRFFNISVEMIQDKSSRTLIPPFIMTCDI